MTVAQDTPSSGRKLMRATAVMASGTLVSRVLGFVRVMMIAFVLGNGTRQADIFSIAQTVPNSLFMLFAGGALNTVLVPQIVRAVKHDPDGGETFINRLMTAFLMILAAITVIMTVATPWIITIYTNSGWRTPALEPHWNSLVMLAYLTMPQIFFYGAFFLIGQVLNAREKFGPMMWAPVANNVVSIVVFALYAAMWGSSGAHADPFTTPQTMYLGLGATFGIVIQTILLVPYMSRLGFKFRPRFDLKDAGLGHTLSLAKWTLAYVGVNQLALMVVDRLATEATVGGQGAGVTAYLNAYLVWIMPHSLITVSLATAMLPSASRLAASGDLKGVGVESMRTMRLSATFLLPAAVGFVALGLPFAYVAFGHGTGSTDAAYVGWTLMAFAPGLIPFTLQYVCLRAFYALEDTRTTFFIQVVIAAVNAALAVLFVMPWKDPATVAPRLALAFSLAYAVGFGLSLTTLMRRLPDLQVRDLGRHLARLLIAAVPAGGLAWLAAWGVSLISDRLVAQVIGLALGAAIAIAVFVLLARVFHISEVQEALAVLRRRNKPADPAKTAEAEAEQDMDLGEPAAPDELEAEAEASEEDLEPDSTPAAAPLDDNPDAIQTYPNVGSDHEPTTGIDLTGAPVARVDTGDVIADRFRLDELLARRANVLTWRAFDLTLSRAVLVYVLAPDDPRAAKYLKAAREAASITDARFLRVLDAAPSDSVDYSGYVVSEYAPGSSLKKLLADGPLSSLEAAWVVREVADALTWVHALMLYHQHLNPDTVIVTTSGNVKIVGFLIEEALTGATSQDDGQATDVRALGQLLYASLVSLYPDGPGFGMPAAPVEDDRIVPPRRVVPGIPAALDVLCDQLLNPQPGDEPAHQSALTVMVTLSRILGTADATGDLERRVQMPVRPIFQASGRSAEPKPAKPEPEEATKPKPIPSPAAVPSPRESAFEEDDYPTTTVDLTSTMMSDTGTFFTPVPPPTGARSSAAEPRPAVHPAPTPEEIASGGLPEVFPPRERPRRRTWLIVLTSAVILVLIVSLIILGVTQGRNSTESSPTPSSGVTTAKPIPIKRAIDFDPTADGGSGDENASATERAYDGNTKTAWQTEQYRGRAQLGGLKPGVGLVVDLGSAQNVSSVTVTFTGKGTSAEVMVPVTANATDEPPLKSRSQWRSMATADDAEGATDFKLAGGATTRYILIYLTSLPADGSGFRGGISEIVVR